MFFGPLVLPWVSFGSPPFIIVKLPKKANEFLDSLFLILPGQVGIDIKRSRYVAMP